MGTLFVRVFCACLRHLYAWYHTFLLRVIYWIVIKRGIFSLFHSLSLRSASPSRPDLFPFFRSTRAKLEWYTGSTASFFVKESAFKFAFAQVTLLEKTLWQASPYFFFTVDYVEYFVHLNVWVCEVWKNAFLKLFFIPFSKWVLWSFHMCVLMCLLRGRKSFFVNTNLYQNRYSIVSWYA